MLRDLIDKTTKTDVVESIYLSDLGRDGVEEVGRYTIKGEAGEVVLLATLKTYKMNDEIDMITAQITGNATGSGGDKNGWIMYYERVEADDMDKARTELKKMIKSFKCEATVK